MKVRTIQTSVCFSSFCTSTYFDKYVLLYYNVRRTSEKDKSTQQNINRLANKMLTAKVNEIIRLYPLGALAKTKCIHLQKLTDSKSKYKKVLRTHRNILAEKRKQSFLDCFFIIYQADNQNRQTINDFESITNHRPTGHSKRF